MSSRDCNSVIPYIHRDPLGQEVTDDSSTAVSHPSTTHPPLCRRTRKYPSAPYRRLRTAATVTAGTAYSLVAAASLPSSTTATTSWGPPLAFQNNNRVPPRWTTAAAVTRKEEQATLHARDDSNNSNNLVAGGNEQIGNSRRTFLVNAVQAPSVTAAALVAMPVPAHASLQSDLEFLRGLGRRRRNDTVLGGDDDDDEVYSTTSADTYSSSDSSDDNSSDQDGSHSSDEDSSLRLSEKRKIMGPRIP